MKHWLRRAAALWIAAVLFANQAGAAPAISAKRAVVLDAATGRVLFDHHAEARAGMASTTKIMTGLLVAETCELDAPVEILPEAVGVEDPTLEVQGASKVRKKCPDAVLIFIIPPSFEVLSRRLHGRHTDNEEVIAGRLAKAREEYKQIKNYDYLVVNDKVSRAAAEILAILTAEDCRTEHRIHLIEGDNAL